MIDSSAPLPSLPPSNATILDLDGALRRLGNDLALYREFLGFFDEDMPKLVAQLNAGITEQNADTIERAAHSLKGLSSNLGADAVTAAAGRVEKAARSGDLQDIASLAEQVLQELDCLMLALAPYRLK